MPRRRRKQYSIRVHGILYRQRFASAALARKWQRSMKEREDRINAGAEATFEPAPIEQVAAEFMNTRAGSDDHGAERLRDYIVPEFKGRAFHMIMKADWLKIFGTPKNPGKLVTHHKLAPATSNRIRTLVRKMYEDARTVLDPPRALHNPIVDIKPLKEAPGEIAFLSSGTEMEAYLNAAFTDPLFGVAYGVAALIFLNTGLRQGNVAGIKWEDADESRGVLTVRRKWNHKAQAFRPGLKGTQESHEIGIGDALLSALQNWRRSTMFNRSEDFIVHDRGGDNLTDKMLWCAHRRTLKRAGLPYVKPHALRHTYATHYLEAGGKIHDLKHILNHSSITVTEKYTHLVKHELKRKAEVFQIAPGNTDKVREITVRSDELNTGQKQGKAGTRSQHENSKTCKQLGAKTKG